MFARNTVLSRARLSAMAFAVLLISPPFAGTGQAAKAGQPAAVEPEAETVTAVLRGYEAALNAKDVETIVSLYAGDGVFMAQHQQPAVGSEQLEAAYRGVFSAITLDITFAIDEVEVVSPTVAWARTRSSGKTTILATGDVVSEGNQELFLLFRPNASAPWKIGRYIFSTTQPRRS